ncbi:hypothetical protein KIN20_009888 [Parelaphostrongylus tenuis]|uniref:Uncharacterized protein n=1 Tax=Parelaphostrongylus tenuis TaxID=148309 RepID=A0AAD5QKY5_PARTN|nr:hypothetical protein KIN20_009888 [Parelaphostrongylus tenuis]
MQEKVEPLQYRRGDSQIQNRTCDDRQKVQEKNGRKERKFSGISTEIMEPQDVEL